MYYPYFRGKQFELLTIRDTAQKLADAHFVPIIEPVKNELKGLNRALKQIADVSGQAIVIVNPFHGGYAKNGHNISTLLNDHFLEQNAITAGILLKAGMSVEDAIHCYEVHKHQRPTFIHAGFVGAKVLSDALVSKLGADFKLTQHVFLEKSCSKPYRLHFKGSKRILLRDGFQRLARNADYQLVNTFSDLHITYEEEGMNGFGDFLTVGDEFVEGGGPAYAVAIHLTFIDPDQDNVMYIYHFVSTTKDTPTDPAGKFAQALRKLINTADSIDSKLFESEALGEYRVLDARQHFPGLGQVKKLSMKHHIETLAEFFSK
jgi:hypothetical protein